MLTIVFAKGWLPPTGKQLSNTFNGYVILIDYGAISNCSANRSVFEILPSVGYFVADVIRNYHLDLKKVECVGHSFGAHVCGYAGASLNGAMQRIIGWCATVNSNKSNDLNFK